MKSNFKLKQTERLIGVLIGFLALAISCIPTESRETSESIPLALQRGDTYVIEGKLNDAERIYQGILKQDAKSAEAYRGLGLVSWTRGVVGEALQDYRKALALRPTFVEAHTDLALILSNIGQHLKAIEHCELAVQSATESGRVRLTYGNVLWRAERYEDAIQQYHIASKQDNRLVEAHIGLGRAYLALAKLDAALEALETAFTLDTNLYDVYYNRGVVYSKQGNYDAAIADFQKVLELRSDDSGAFFEIGFAYQQQGQYNQAIQSYQKAIEISPDDAVVHHNLARCYVRQGNKKAAEKERKITEALQAYEEKIDHARAYINQYSDKAEGYAYLASIYYQRGKWELAIEQYNLAIVVDPHFTSAYRNLAELYIQRRNLDRAAAIYQKALEQNAADVETRVMLALLYKEQGRMREAMKQLNIAQELLESSRSANTREHLEMLSFVYYAKGLYDKAEAVLQELMKLDPNNAQYQRQLGTIRAAHQRGQMKKND